MNRKIIAAILLGTLSVATSAQKMVVMDVDNTATAGTSKYVVIDATDLPRGTVKRGAADYTDVTLYDYESTIEGNAPKMILDRNGQPQQVPRLIRHTSSGTGLGTTVSLKFAIAPQDINDDGGTDGGTLTMDWARAGGWVSNVNTIAPTTPTDMAVEKGCPMYRGRDEKDKPGTWRIPTLREAYLIEIFSDAMPTAAGTGFVGFASSTNYWTGTEYTYEPATEAMTILYSPTGVIGSRKTNLYRVRCIRDL